MSACVKGKMLLNPNAGDVLPEPSPGVVAVLTVNGVPYQRPVNRPRRVGAMQLYCPEHNVWSPSGRLCDLCNADPEFWQKHEAARARFLAERGAKPCIPCGKKAKSDHGQIRTDRKKLLDAMTPVPKAKKPCRTCGQKIVYSFEELRRAAERKAAERGVAMQYALLLSWGMPQYMESVARGLVALGVAPQVILRGKGAWKNESLSFIATHKPSWLFTWARLSGNDGETVQAAATGARTICMDFGVYPHYGSVLFDPMGENAASSIVGRFDALLKDPAELLRMDKALSRADEYRARAERMGIETDDAMLAKLHLDGIPEGFYFVALQRTNPHPDKVLELDAPAEVRNPTALCKTLIALAQEHGKYLVIKQHPQSHALAGIPARSEHHRVLPHQAFGADNDRAFAWLAQRCERFLTVNSTSLFLAMLMGKPVCMLGRGWATGNALVHECATAAEAFGPHPFAYTTEPIARVGMPLVVRRHQFVSLLISRTVPKEELSRSDRIREMVERFYPGAMKGTP